MAASSEEKKDIKKGFLISFIVLIGKGLGFVKQSVIAWAFGIDANTDVLFAADGFGKFGANDVEDLLKRKTGKRKRLIL